VNDSGQAYALESDLGTATHHCGFQQPDQNDSFGESTGFTSTESVTERNNGDSSISKVRWHCLPRHHAVTAPMRYGNCASKAAAEDAMSSTGVATCTPYNKNPLPCTRIGRKTKRTLAVTSAFGKFV
jgi:hypothetical protein